MLRYLILPLVAWAILVGCNRQESTKSRIVYIPKNTGNPYFDPLIEGFKKAGRENGFEVDIVAPATADPAGQIPLIKDQIQLGVAAIAISPNSPDALVPVFDEARRKGIIIVTVDSDITGNESHRDASVLTVDPQTIGQSQVELMGSLMDYKGEFAILSATTEAPNQNLWISIMKKTLETDSKYKEMKLVDTVYGNDEPQRSTTEAESLLTKYPTLKGIIAPTTVGIAAAAQAVETKQKAAQVQVTGLGTPNQMRQFIKNGTVKAFALWSPEDEGYVCGQVTAQLAGKKIQSAPGTTFTAGTLGNRTIGEKSVIITGPPVTFTKENIDRYHF